MVMRRVVHKRIRRTEDGVDLAIDFNADIAINVGPTRPAAERDRGAGAPVERDEPAPPEANEEGKDT
jgi:hypothetical protein